MTRTITNNGLYLKRIIHWLEGHTGDIQHINVVHTGDNITFRAHIIPDGGLSATIKYLGAGQYEYIKIMNLDNSRNYSESEINRWILDLEPSAY